MLTIIIFKTFANDFLSIAYFLKVFNINIRYGDEMNNKNLMAFVNWQIF